MKLHPNATIRTLVMVMATALPITNRHQPFAVRIPPIYPARLLAIAVVLVHALRTVLLKPTEHFVAILLKHAIPLSIATVLFWIALLNCLHWFVTMVLYALLTNALVVSTAITASRLFVTMRMHAQAIFATNQTDAGLPQSNVRAMEIFAIPRFVTMSLDADTSTTQLLVTMVIFAQPTMYARMVPA
jgi:hypothetical protein